MPLSYLLYFLILILFCVTIRRASFFTKSGLTATWLIVFFLIRAGMGLLNCYLSYHYFEISDSLTFHNIGLNEYYQLTNNFNYFISETFHDYGNNYSGMLETSHSFWNNLKENVIVKSLAVLNLLTFRNFYINTLIFNILVFVGTVALYRALSTVFMHKKILSIFVFLFPSALFFTSTIHRDGLVWMSLGIIIYNFGKLLTQGYRPKRFLVFIAAFVLIFLLRNYLAFVLIPGLAAWWLSARNQKQTALIFVLITTLSVVLFFSLRYVIPLADFPQYVAKRQAAFNEISAISRSYLPLPPLQPSLLSYLKTLPPAFSHVFLMPAIWKLNSYLELPFASETLFIQLLFIACIIRRKFFTSPVIIFLSLIVIISLLIIGITVPNLGAILRYKSIYFQLLSIVFLYGITYNSTIQKID